MIIVKRSTNNAELTRIQTPDDYRKFVIKNTPSYLRHNQAIVDNQLYYTSFDFRSVSPLRRTTVGEIISEVLHNVHVNGYMNFFIDFKELVTQVNPTDVVKLVLYHMYGDAIVDLTSNFGVLPKNTYSTDCELYVDDINLLNQRQPVNVNLTYSIASILYGIPLSELNRFEQVFTQSTLVPEVMYSIQRQEKVKQEEEAHFRNCLVSSKLRKLY